MPTLSLIEECELFRSHFAEQQEGTPCSFESTINDERMICANECDVQNLDYNMFVRLVPCLIELSQQFHIVNPFSAGGSDNILGAIYRRFPRLFSAIYFPLVF